MPVLAALAALLSGSAQAQRPRDLSSPPRVWLSLSGGHIWLADVPDGSTNANWRFGDGWPLRISLEASVGQTASLGVAAMWLRAPVLYVSSACGQCNAHASVAYYGPHFRFGGGRGLHQVVEIGAGVMQYGNFEVDATGEAMPPDDPNYDFAYSLGAGVGYGFARDWAMELVFTNVNAVHERRNLLANTQSVRSHRAIRMGLRVGF